MDSQISLHALSELGTSSLDQVSRYLAALQSRNYAQCAIAAVVSIIKKLLRSLPEASRLRVGQDFTRVTAADLDDYIEVAQKHGQAPSTINYTLSMLKGFFEFLREAGEMQHQPVIRHRHSLFASDPLPKPMTESDLIAFFGYSRDTCNFRTQSKGTRIVH
jgi:site-specific recombinase XerD